MYMVGVGFFFNQMDVVNLICFFSKFYVVCVELKLDNYFLYNQKYFIIVFVYNGGYKQQNVLVILNGGMCD